MMYAGVVMAVVLAVFTIGGWDSVAPMAVPGSAQCTDKVACKLYTTSICSDPQYLPWAENNCAKFCNLCGGSHPDPGVGKMLTTPPSTCHNKITNCADYGTKMCSDPRFYSWVNENCQAFCNRCSDKCEDKVANCADYGATLCTELSYYNWVEMNCRKFCARCTS